MIEVNQSTLINDILTSLQDIDSVNDEVIRSIKNVLQFKLSEFVITKEESTELTTHMDSNLVLLKQYLISMHLRGCTKSSISVYKLECTNLLTYINKNIKEITYTDIMQYMAYGKLSKHWKDTTYNNKLHVLKGFFSWLYEEQYICINPSLKIKPAKVEHKLGKVITSEQRELIRCACTNERDLSIVDLLYSSGMRISELVSLNRSDINFQTLTATVYGKGKKERVIYFSAPCKVHLQKYLQSRSDNNEALFVGYRKPNNRLSIDGIQHMLKNLCTSPELKGINLSPHVFRRSVGTDMLNKGATLEIVAEKLGHVNMQVTKDCYAFLSKDSLQQAHNKYVS